MILCVCLTCGVRNNHSTDDGYCQNGHDDWLEYIDFQYDETYDEFVTIERTMKLFGLSLEELEEQFMDNSIKQFKII